ncbi:hypothetical protein F8388_012794 [Cannabis sativa]|uniref:Calcium-transporting P-type ATPase N-terminal autoinhibitory domain-containing protein n=1 Tax=Cannabis sativa TaxID=3483 RepID=A0A7J6F6B3_CANSA|nr:hypothetical protein F8388_012794 [Cannabis sativa]
MLLPIVSADGGYLFLHSFIRFNFIHLHSGLVLNASRRFRYTLDLKKEEEKKQILRKIRAHAQQIRAAYLFKVGAIAEPETNGVDLFHCRINRIGTKSLTLVTKDIQPINRVCYLLKREKFNYKRKNLNFSGTVPSVRTPLKLD